MEPVYLSSFGENNEVSAEAVPVSESDLPMALVLTNTDPTVPSAPMEIYSEGYTLYNTETFDGVEQDSHTSDIADNVVIVSAESLAGYIPSNNEITKNFTIYENERYSPISGWSQKSLMLHDRKHISTYNGESSWNNFEEASIALLSIGWKWEENSYWDVLRVGSIDDNWKYATEFGMFTTYQSGNDVKSNTHFVRRRAYQRTAVFRVENISRNTDQVYTCDHCNSDTVLELSSLILECLNEISLLRYKSAFTIEKINKIKNGIITTLLLNEASAVFIYSIGNIRNKLHVYVEEIRRKVGFKKALNTLQSVDDNIRIEICKNEFGRECEQIAKEIIRRHDIINRYHCNMVNCGALCPFAMFVCQNIGCRIKLCGSTQRETHDNECDFAYMNCPRECGCAMFLRRELNVHLKTLCDLRTVPCAYWDIGCCQVITYRERDQHIHDNCAQHLSLAMTRISDLRDDIVRVREECELRITRIRNG